MADVKIIDIDGVQWDVKDQVARDKIITINEQLTVKEVSDIPIILNEGYTAKSAIISSIIKYGKMHCGTVVINNVSGNNIGTTITAVLGKVSINTFKTVVSVGIEYKRGVPCRLTVDNRGNFSISESMGVMQGDNAIIAQLIWIEE